MDMHVPTHPGLISWSNWANGGAQWSGTGLPSEDAAYRIVSNLGVRRSKRYS